MCGRIDRSGQASIQGRAFDVTIEAKAPPLRQTQLDYGGRDHPLLERRRRVQRGSADVERQKGRPNRRRQQSSLLELTTPIINLASRHIVAAQRAPTSRRSTAPRRGSPAGYLHQPGDLSGWVRNWPAWA